MSKQKIAKLRIKSMTIGLKLVLPFLFKFHLNITWERTK